MRMMKRMLPLVALVLVLVMSLASCSLFGGAGFDEDQIYKSTASNYLYANQAYQLDNTATSTYGGETTLIRFDDGDREMIYNLENGQVVMSDSSPDTTLMVSGKLICRISTYGESSTYAYFSPTGNMIVDGLKVQGQFANDTLFANGNVYRFDMDTYEVIKIYARSELAGSLPTAAHYTEDYYIVNTGKMLLIYDEEYNFNGSWTVPDYATEPGFYYFEDGYVICQYSVLKNDMDEEYDYLEGTEKYDLVTLRFDPDDCSYDELDTDYFIDAMRSMEDSIYGEDVPAVLEMIEIKDKRLDENADPIYMVADSKLKGDRVLELNGENVYIYAVGNGHVVARSMTRSAAWILDEDGDIVADISGAKGMTSTYIVSDAAIYDYNMNRVSELTSGDRTYTYVTTVGDNLVFRATAVSSTGTVEKYYMYRNNWFEEIGEVNYVELYTDYYRVLNTTSESYTYNYYDASSSYLFSSYGNSASKIATAMDGQVMLFQATTTDGNYVYYRVSK